MWTPWNPLNFMNWAERAVVKKVCKAIPFNGHKVKDKVIDVVSKTIPDRFKNGVVYGAIKKGCKEVMVLDICNCLSGSRFLAKGKFYLIIFQSNFNNVLHCNTYLGISILIMTLCLISDSGLIQRRVNSTIQPRN